MDDHNTEKKTEELKAKFKKSIEWLNRNAVFGAHYKGRPITKEKYDEIKKEKQDNTL